MTIYRQPQHSYWAGFYIRFWLKGLSGLRIWMLLDWQASVVLQTNLKVQTSLRLVNFNFVVIDVLAMLHGAVHWQKGGTVADLIDGVKNFTLRYLHFPDIYLIFARYHICSIKSNTRAAKVNSFTHGYNLFRQSPLLSKDDSLSCAKSKVQLKEQIPAGLVDIDLTQTTHRASGEGRGPSSTPLYHFHPLMNINTIIYNFPREMAMIYF